MKNIILIFASLFIFSTISYAQSEAPEIIKEVVEAVGGDYF